MSNSRKSKMAHIARTPVFYARHHVPPEEDHEEITLALPKSTVKQIKQLARRESLSFAEAIAYLQKQQETSRRNQRKVDALEEVLDATLRFIYDNNLDAMTDVVPKKELDALQSAFDGMISFLFESEDNLRETLVDLMNLALEYWLESTDKTKIDLAEESKLWKVYLDRGTFQTRTLDKYLSLQGLPKRPNWKRALKTGQFVLDQCDLSSEQQQKLEAAIQSLQVVARSKQGKASAA